MSAEYLKEMFALDGQTAVVIGGGGVLGGALSAGLAQAGAYVIIADLNEAGCQGQLATIQKLGLQAEYALVDVASRASLEGLLAHAIRRRGRVHILVNCAGVNAGANFLEHSEADWDRVMAVNLKAVFVACQVFAAHMVEQGGGAIVNIGSVTSHLPLSRVFAYAASKAGVLNLTRNIAQELAAKGVRVNCICPGFFPAEQNRKLLTPERIENIMRGTPMRRFGEAEELVGALLLLVAPKAGSFITGTHINVDGGFTAAWF
jgi:NAD(P)-dependent dehydrogenase (short-subunit alcohol dehydrogenase family)